MIIRRIDEDERKAKGDVFIYIFSPLVIEIQKQECEMMLFAIFEN